MLSDSEHLHDEQYCGKHGDDAYGDPCLLYTSTVLFETPLEGEERERCEEQLAAIFKAKIGCTPEAKGVPMGELPRSEKKSKRIFDSRY